MTTTKVQPGDFCIVPVSGWSGLAISCGQWLNGEKFTRHDHAQIYTGMRGPGRAVPTSRTGWTLENQFDWTASAYPDGHSFRQLTCAPERIPGATWSSGKIALTDAQRAAIVQWCADHAAVRYSWADYGALTLHRLGIDDPALQRYIDSSRTMICSQYVTAAYLAADVRLFPATEWDGYVTPEMLAQRIGA